MAEMGRLAVWVALLAGGAAVVGRRRWMLTVAVLAAGVATLVLARALVGNDYSLVYVADFSRRGASAPYRLAALWGGMAGSLLWFATLAGAAGWWTAGRVRSPSARGIVAAVTGGLVAAPAGLVLAFADPFRRLEVPAIDGGGLTPILEHPAMLYHPPLLYLGLATLTGPFALTVAGLLGRGDSGWPGQVRRSLIVPWTLLAAGMLAGAHWAYVELGWGGYWAWDPVENTALLPWLAITLALHAGLRPRKPARAGTPAAAHPDPAVASDSDRATEPSSAAGTPAIGPPTVARGREPAVLGQATMVCVAFLLALTGAMLTRSGAVSSVHAFAESRAIGRALGALVVATAVGVAVVLGRAFRTAPAAGEHGGGLLGRLLAGHFVVVGTVLGVATIGTLAPLVTDLRGGDGIAIEGRYFASFAGPLAAAGLVLVALVPLALRLSAARRRSSRTPGLAAAATRPDGAAPATAVGGAIRAGHSDRQVAAHAAHAGLVRVALVPLGLRRRTGRRLIAAELAVAGGGAALGLGALYEAGGDVDWPVAVLGSAAGAALAAAVGGGIRAGRGGGRVAAHVAHAGLGLVLLGVAGTASGRTETLPVAPGERVELLGVTVEYRGVEVVEDVANGGGRVKGSSAVVADVWAAGHDLRPSLVAYPAISRVIAETSLVSTPWRDVQVGLRDAADDGSAIVQIGVHPLQILVWWGGLVVIAAGILLAVEHRRRPHRRDRRDRLQPSITSELSQPSEPLAQPSML